MWGGGVCCTGDHPQLKAPCATAVPMAAEWCPCGICVCGIVCLIFSILMCKPTHVSFCHCVGCCPYSLIPNTIFRCVTGLPAQPAHLLADRQEQAGLCCTGAPDMMMMQQLQQVALTKALAGQMMPSWPALHLGWSLLQHNHPLVALVRCMCALFWSLRFVSIDSTRAD